MPTLPARKAGGKRVPTASTRTQPTMEPQFATLEDGTEVPLQIPPGMPAEQAQALIEYLKVNPQAAKAAYDQAQAILANPAMAQAFMNMNARPDAAMADRFAVLKDDPELKDVFEDLTKNGASAMQKYWDDDEMMVKISRKLREAGGLQSSDQAEEAASKAAAMEARKAPFIQTIHDAAKYGDEDAAEKMLADGVDVNKKNDRGISPLGVAVGFNKSAMVRWLLAKKADIHFSDAAGNNLMHYAAGYGRQEVAGILLEAGCNIDALNNSKQAPIDVARMNRELAMVRFLKEKGAVDAAADKIAAAVAAKQSQQQQGAEGSSTPSAAAAVEDGAKSEEKVSGEGGDAKEDAAVKPKAKVTAKVVKVSAKK